MAAFFTSLSTSHSVIGLGCKDYEQPSCQQKCELMAAPRVQCNKIVGSKPRNGAATRLLVQNSSGSGEDSLVTTVRMSGGDAQKEAASQLGVILEDEGRPKLLRKLSEANQYIRHLQHELRDKEDALLDTASELSAMEMELQRVTAAFSSLSLQHNRSQALVPVAHEISRQGIKPGTRKINGRYIHSHLASRLEEIQKILHERTKGADQVRTRSVDLAFYGMAEAVQVMGSFNGWTRGEQMSPETTGTFTKFTATIKLRPGRYEIKFLVDGEWHMSSILPTVGEGLTMNNLLIVDPF